MTLSADQVDDIKSQLGGSVSFESLARFDWRRQTDALRLMFIGAKFFADLGPAAVFVDGHIEDHVKRRALGATAGVKQFFNRRFHDAGFKFRRLVLFDTKGTKKMGGRGSGRGKLHFHALIERPPGWTDADLKRMLVKIFGNASAMGQRQFHLSRPRTDQYHTHNEVQVTGALGKLIYAISHAGTTYANLELNDDGKRSRRAPLSRGWCNRSATGLARGVPSNFMAEIAFYDTASKKAGKSAFDAWVRAERRDRKEKALDDEPTPRPLMAAG